MPGAEPPNSGQLPVVRNIFDVSSEFLGQYKTWLEQNPPSIPVTQIVGFSQFTAQPATPVVTAGSTASLTYTTVFGADAGPSLLNLPDGQYVLMFGCRLGGNTGYMNLKLNGVTPGDDNDSASAALAAGSVSVARVLVKTLKSGGANTVESIYRTDSATTASGALRWLVAFKFANA